MPTIAALCDVPQTSPFNIVEPQLQQNELSFNGVDSANKLWTVAKSSALYRVPGWGAPYYCVNEQGRMAVRPHGEATLVSDEIDIMSVVERVVSEGMATPLILRFPDVLRHRMESLQAAFEQGISRHSYQGQYQGVFPVKCNPDRYVVEDIVKYGKQLRFGLEAGSKPELMMAMSILCGHGHPEALLICNGYKDIEYVHMAILAGQLGVKSVIVMEQEEELDLVIKVSERMGVRPVLGIRAKLNTKHDGHWGETSGEKGKFGLNTREIVNVVSKLRRAGMLECLQLLHFHIGSQIPSLELVDEGVSEAAHFFCELYLMGANMKRIDIGGGLGVDYDGSNSSTSESSIGYTLVGYAEQVVSSIKVACGLKNVRCPTITCESGRGLISHQSVLVFDVVSTRPKAGGALEDMGVPLAKGDRLPLEMATVYEEIFENVRAAKYDKALDCATSLKAEGTRLFKLGSFSLELRAMLDKLYDNVKSISVEYKKQHGGGGNSTLGDGPPRMTQVEPATYHVNLSIFKSLPDSWAIRQLFPFAPIHRLEEEPTVAAILSDLTCDSDGKVAHFIGHGDDMQPTNFLRLHPLNSKRPYYVGMFLAGAYQEILGSIHNLFGMPDIVHVTSCNGPTRFQITLPLPGQTIGNVLGMVHHDREELLLKLKARVEDSLVTGRLQGEQEAFGILNNFVRMFGSKTYLSSNYSTPTAGWICTPQFSG